jgi:hypothetical protein
MGRWLGLLLLLLSSCKSLERGAGKACTRSSQCAVGLACIEQVCSDDLGALAEQSTVPDLMPMPEDAALMADGAAEDDAGR